MNKTITLELEEINTFKEIASQQQQIPLEIGKVELELKNLSIKKEQLLQFYDSLLTKQQEHTKSLLEKYGEGSLNTDTWEFTPAEK